MTNIELNKLHFDDDSVQMILSKDVYSRSGTLLARKDSVIDEECLKRLSRHGINFVEGYERGNTPPPQRFPFVTTTIQPAKMEEFNTFEREYKQTEKEVENVLASIGNGAEVNIEQTYKITGNILDKIEIKRDVFLYLDFMQEFDDHTFSHCNNVSLLCNVFGSWVGLDAKEIEQITVAGILHDIGKTKIPKEILNKPGKLTDEEFKIMQKHTTLGYQMLKAQNIPDEMKLSALLHHEKIDGSGYPMHFKGDKINKFSKIVAVCDIYDAMTAKRSYKEKLCPFDVIGTFETGLYGALDTDLLIVFLRNIAESYVHSWAILSDGREAEIILINKDDLSRPMVRTSDNEFINLSEHREITIDRLK